MTPDPKFKKWGKGGGAIAQKSKNVAPKFKKGPGSKIKIG